MQRLALFGGPPIRAKAFTAWPVFGEAEEQRLLRTLRSGQWGRLSGSEVTEFEQRFAEMHGCKHGIAIVNGTVSLRIALLAAGIRAEDEVVIPPYTFISTASAVIEANAIPVFADIDLETFNIDPQSIEASITPRTKAIIPVHFAGQIADMDAIMAVAQKHKLSVIEDAAHAHGATDRGRSAGSIGHLGSFSFQSSKNMTAGEGGIIITNDDALADACRSIHNCGRIAGGIWYEHHVIAGNYRLGEFQGAVLNAQLDRLASQTETRHANGQYLAAKLAHIPGLHPQKRPASCSRHSYHLFMLRFDGAVFGAPRDAVINALRAEGIPCSPGYGFPLHRQPLFRNKAFGPFLQHASDRLDYTKTNCPNSDRICNESIWLEQTIFLGARSDMDDIAAAFTKVYENRAVLTK